MLISQSKHLQLPQANPSCETNGSLVLTMVDGHEPEISVHAKEYNNHQ